jgi:hypothetical protein
VTTVTSKPSASRVSKSIGPIFPVACRYVSIFCRIHQLNEPIPSRERLYGQVQACRQRETDSDGESAIGLVDELHSSFNIVALL